jgi:hypothetical protein
MAGMILGTNRDDGWKRGMVCFVTKVKEGGRAIRHSAPALSPSVV